MISDDLKHKYANHINQVNNYNESYIGELFDKFKSLFGCYNMLYSTVPDLLRKAGVNLTGNDSDRKIATKYVQQYLTTEAIMAAFQKNNIDDLQSLTKVLKLDLFNIKLDSKGESQKGADALILNNLESGNNDRRCAAILDILYAVRCNTVHGAKDLIEHQRILLVPIVHLLYTLTVTLYNKLNN